MIRLSYRLFLCFIALFLIYSLVSFYQSLPLLNAPHQAISTYPLHLLHITTLSGLLAGGVYVALGDLPDRRIFHWFFYGWLALTILTVLGVSARGLDMAQSAVILMIIGMIARHIHQWEPVFVIWAAGMAVYAIIYGFVRGECLASADCETPTRIIRSIGLNGALIVAAAALGFWLMHRFSNITGAWGRLGVKVIAGWLSIAGVFMALGHIGADLPPIVTLVGQIFILLAYLVYAAHSYRALSDQNNNRTLSMHWYTLGLLLFIVAGGLLGSVSLGIAPPATSLLIFQTRLVLLGVVMVCIGVVNQAVAEMRGENRRVTGLMPFWLVAFGVLLGQSALGIATIGEGILRDVIGSTATTPYAGLIPYYRLSMFGDVAVFLGMILYTLGLWVRRVKFTSPE